MSSERPASCPSPGRPSDCRAWRTARIPSLASRSAMARSSAGSASSQASRWRFSGRNRGARGGLSRPPRWPVPSRPGRPPCWARPPPPLRRRPSRGPSVRSADLRARFGAIVTPSVKRFEPRCSRRGGGGRSVFVGSTWRTAMPSTLTSASTRSTSPTAAPAGTRPSESTPFGWRAPAARQVQVPSGRRLVSMTSRRCDMASTLPACPGKREPVTCLRPGGDPSYSGSRNRGARIIGLRGRGDSPTRRT